MAIMVTGAAGYIGSALCQELLDMKHSVVGIDNFIYKNYHSLSHLIAHPRFSLYNLDVNEQIEDIIHIGKLNKIHAIIPLAAIVGAKICDDNQDLAYKTNTESIIKLVEAFPHARIVYPNTNSGYGQVKDGQFCTEETPMNPISLYGQTKLETEQWLINKGFRATSLRLATVFGVSTRMRLDLLVNDFTFKLFNTNDFLLFDPSFNRNYVHVKDVATVMRICVESDKTVGDIFNLGNDNINCSKHDLLIKLATILNKRNILNVSIGNESDPDQRNYLVSSKKLIDKISWLKMKSLEDGVLELSKLFNSWPKNKEKIAKITETMYNKL